jgi:hypothetical protein
MCCWPVVLPSVTVQFAGQLGKSICAACTLMHGHDRMYCQFIMSVCLYVCMHACTHTTHTHNTRKHTNTQTHRHTPTHTPRHKHTHTPTHTDLNICSLIWSSVQRFKHGSENGFGHLHWPEHLQTHAQRTHTHTII